MFDDEFSEIDRRVEIKESGILSALIDFYIRILEIFDKFSEKIHKMEIKPKVRNLRTDKYSLDYINFLIIIKDKMYSVILINTEYTELSQKDLKKYFKIFVKSPRIDGILIIFNDDDLHSLLLLGDDLYSGFLDFPNFKDFIQDKFKKLDNLLETLTSEKRYEFPKIMFHDFKISDIINDFEKNLKDIKLIEESRRLGAEKKEILSKLDDIKIKKLINVFEKYLESDKDRKKEFRDFLDNFGLKTF